MMSTDKKRKFLESKVYIIVPSVDAVNNYTMLNASTSVDFSNVIKNDVANKYLFEVIEPVDAVFLGYPWLSKLEINLEMLNAEWVVSEAE